MSTEEYEKTKISIFTVAAILMPILLICTADHLLIQFNFFISSEFFYQIAIYYQLAINYCLIFFLNLDNTLVEFNTQMNNSITQSIDGTIDGNAFAYFPRKLNAIMVNASSPNEFISNKHCLPKAHQGERMFTMLNINIGIIFVITVFQAYFMRLRAICAGCVYPKRDEERAVWLYNHILEIRSIRENSGFIKSNSFLLSMFKWLLVKIGYILSNIIYGTIMYSLCW